MEDEPPTNTGATSLFAGRGLIAGLLIIIVILAVSTIFFATAGTARSPPCRRRPAART